MPQIYLSSVKMNPGAFSKTAEFMGPAQQAVKSMRDGFISQPPESFLAMLNELKDIVTGYITEFDDAVNKYKKDNNLMTAMAGSLDRSKMNGNGTAEICISAKQLHNKKQSTQHLITTMTKGHSLLLQMRQALTGQNLHTKFYIETDDGLYVIDEDKLDMGLTLSTFGGGTVSNPFSVAYDLDKSVQKQMNTLLSEETDNYRNLKESNLYQQIMGIKPAYLADKSLETGREYSNIYFDSKDAEIMELYRQIVENQGEAPVIDLMWYKQRRQTMGGGGGYATAFYKMGDVGLTQVKFFSLKNKRKNALVNFARFSLLRDKYKLLEKILSRKDQNREKILDGLADFFIEKEANLTNQVSKAIAQQARDIFGLAK